MPRAAIDLGAVCKRPYLRGLKAVEPLILVVVEHAEQAPAPVVERTGHRHRVDGAVNDTEGTPGGPGHLLTVLDNDLRQMEVGRIIRDKEGLARCVMGNNGV